MPRSRALRSQRRHAPRRILPSRDGALDLGFGDIERPRLLGFWNRHEVERPAVAAYLGRPCGIQIWRRKLQIDSQPELLLNRPPRAARNNRPESYARIELESIAR